MNNFKKMCTELELSIENSYSNGCTLEDAEKLAGKFLQAQFQVSSELRKLDLDSRMRKAGLKAIRAAVYMEAVGKADKKPSDTLLEQQVNMNDMVSGEQQRFDESESERDELERYYHIFREAHVHFRQMSKGRFE